MFSIEKNIHISYKLIATGLLYNKLTTCVQAQLIEQNLSTFRVHFVVINNFFTNCCYSKWTFHPSNHFQVLLELLDVSFIYNVP